MRLHRALGTLGGTAAFMLTANPAGAEAETVTERHVVHFTDPGFVGPCDGSTGTLTVDAEELVHATSTGRTFRLISTLNGTFSVDFDDPTVADVAGHFVSQHRENVNHAQLKDLRVTDMIHSIGVSTDGTSLPVHTTFTVLVGADGSVEVQRDTTRCGGALIS